MANLMHKLIRNKCSVRIITSLKPPQLPEFTPLNPLQSHLGTSRPEFTDNPILSFDHTSTEDLKSGLPFQIYPSSPCGYCLNSNSKTEFNRLGVVETEDPTTVWADSVKKKRKKKMNKHKYRKLRKRLRRKT